MADRSVKVYLKGDISDFNRAMLAASAGTKAFVKDLDTSTDRMQNLVQTSLALGPALVPVGAAAVPAIAGLANQLAFAAAGAGVAALAFSGIGDALKATNDYAIEPTAANFDRMKQSLDELGPAGREFVGFLQELRPQLQGLQDAAQEGLLPGVQLGLTEMMTLLPQVERIVTQVATALGDLASEAGFNLASSDWQEFFTFLENEARPTLINMGRTLGNFAKGFSELWMAFDPLSDQFSASFLKMSRDFSAWADGLEETQGFQEFIDYIQENGPQAWDALSSIGNALLQVVEAAAPVGAAVLPVIEVLADTLATIADSDVGPILIGAAAGISAISRAVALYNVANGSAMAGLLGKTAFGGAGRAAKDLPAASRAYLDFGAALDRTGPKVGKFATTSERLGSSLKATGKIAAGAGGLAFVMSDLDRKMGLSNTAMLGMAGALAGPWGAAIGAGVGLALDFAAANDDIGEAVDRANAAVGDTSLSIQQRIQAVEASLTVLADKRAKIIADQGSAGAFAGAADTSDVDEASKKLLATRKELQAAAADQRFAEAGISEAMRGATQSTREQTLALLDNIAAHNERNNQNLSQLDKEIAYQRAIDATTAAIKENGRNTDINTAGGQANVATLSAQAAAWNNLAPATQLAAGAQEKAREQFIASAEAMGYNAERAREMADDYLNIPPDVATEIKLLGKDATAAQIADVLDQYNLAREDVVAQLKAANLTQPQIDEVLSELDALDRKKTDPKIEVKGSPEAQAAAQAVKKALDAINPFKRIVIQTEYRSITTPTSRNRNPRQSADGGEITGPGGPRDDLIPVMLSNKEIVVNAFDAQEHRDLLLDLNAGRFRGRKPEFRAYGGEIGGPRIQRMSDGVTSRPSGDTLTAPTSFEASLVGARVEFGPDGLGTFVDGRIRIHDVESQREVYS